LFAQFTQRGAGGGGGVAGATVSSRKPEEQQSTTEITMDLARLPVFGIGRIVNGIARTSMGFPRMKDWAMGAGDSGIEGAAASQIQAHTQKTNNLAALQCGQTICGQKDGVQTKVVGFAIE